MEIHLVRHAIAEDRRAGLEDSERALTAEGRARFVEAVGGMRRLGLAFDRCWHSPWRRAVETAELLAPLVGGERSAEPMLAAPPGAALLARLAAAGSEGSLALVGHEPWLSDLAQALCVERAKDPAAWRLRKGGLIWLRGEPVRGGMEIEALLGPSLLRRARPAE